MARAASTAFRKQDDVMQMAMAIRFLICTNNHTCVQLALLYTFVYIICPYFMRYFGYAFHLHRLSSPSTPSHPRGQGARQVDLAPFLVERIWRFRSSRDGFAKGAARHEAAAARC